MIEHSIGDGLLRQRRDLQKPVEKLTLVVQARFPSEENEMAAFPPVSPPSFARHCPAPHPSGKSVFSSLPRLCICLRRLA